MGPVAVVAAGVATLGGVAIIASQMDNFLSSQNIGGKLTEIQRTRELRVKKVLRKDQLDQYLRICCVPENKILQAQRLKISKIGSVESLEFMITDSQYAGRLIVIKSKRFSDDKIQILLCKERIEAKYSAPQIQSNYSRSGARYTSRSLNMLETEEITKAVKDKAKQVTNELKAITI